MELETLRGHLSSLLEASAKYQADDALASVKSLDTYIREACVSHEDTSLALSTCLDEECGLPAFISKSLQTHGKGGAKPREEVFKLLEARLQALPLELLNPHATRLFELALSSFRREEGNPARSAMLSMLQALLDARPEPLTQQGDRLAQAAKQLQATYLRDRQLSQGTRGEILDTLGRLLDAAPEEVCGASAGFTTRWLLDECLRVLVQEGSSTKPSQVLVTGALAGLSSAMSACTDEEAKAAEDEAWRHLLRSTTETRGLTRYQGLRAALRMLVTQGQRFRGRLLEQALMVINALAELKVNHSNKPVREAADRALVATFEQIAAATMEEGGETSAQNLRQDTHRSLLHRMRKLLVDPTAGSKQKRIALCGIGALAAPTLKFSGPEGLEDLLKQLTKQVQFGALIQDSQDFADDKITTETALLTALSQVIQQLPTVGTSALQHCLQVAERVAGTYLVLWPSQRPVVHAALDCLLAAVAQRPDLSASLLPQLVSALLALTLQPADPSSIGGVAREVTPLDPEPPWKTYLHLWQHLLQGSPSGSPGASPTSASKEPLWSAALFNAAMRAVVDALQNLDLEYHDAREQSLGQEAEESVSESKQGLVAHNLADMQAFINLSGFFSELLPLFGKERYCAWADTLLVELVRGASERPLLSSYYRMLTTVLRLSASAGLLDNPHLVNTQVCRKFLQKLASAARLYTDELLSACLELLLSAPPSLLVPQEMAGPLQNALRLGLQSPELAVQAMDALELLEARQHAALPLIAPLVVPLLDPYLRPIQMQDAPNATFKEGAASVDDEEAEAEDGVILEAEGDAKEVYRARKAAEAGAARQRAARTQGLAAVQLRVQSWLGRLGSLSDSLLAGGEADVKGRRWDVADRAGIGVTFPESAEEATVWLDTLLPQVAELAENSSDRASRVAACEFLHASILWMVGKNATRPARREEEDYETKPTQLHELLRGALPVALLLAASAEPVARQLFRPLIMSLVHWYTRAARREAAETMALLESILDGLTNDSNGALRLVCAEACEEFLVWSAKHMPLRKGDAVRSSASNVNAASLLRRLLDRMSNPDAYHRLGTGLALAQCAEALGREEGLADTHLLEALQHCLLALRDTDRYPPGTGTQRQLAQAIKELVKVLYKRPAVLEDLQVERADRPGFASLAAFLEWVWPLTVFPEHYCREMAMWTLERMVTLVYPDTQGGRALAAWHQEHLDSHSIKLSDTVMGFSEVKSPGSGATGIQSLQSKEWLQALEAALHWCTWALDQLLIQPSDLQDATASNAHVAAALQHFMRDLSAEADRAGSGPATMLPRLPGLALRFVQQMLGEQVMDSDLDGLSDFLILAMFSPEQALGRADTEAGRQLTLQAKAVLEAAVTKLPGLLRAMKPKVSALLDEAMATGALFMVSPGDAMSLDLDEDFLGADNASASPAERAALLSGLILLAQLQLPKELDLIPPRMKKDLSDRLVRAAIDLQPGASVEQQAAAEGALSLAIRLGIKVPTMLDTLLSTKSGASFYEEFKAAVNAWLLWNASEVCGRLCSELLGDGIAAQNAQQLLTGMLESLQRSNPNGRSDPRQRSFLDALLPHLPKLQPLLGAAKGRNEKAAADQRSLFLRLLSQLLSLDHTAVLSGPSSAFLVDAYIGILSSKAQEDALLRADALRLLAPFAEQPDQAQAVRNAVDALVVDVFPQDSWELKAGSPQAIGYRAQLAALLDSLVTAAEEGSKIVPFLEALLPLLREMGLPKKHSQQRLLKTRLLLIASAPWKDLLASGQVAGSSFNSSQATQATQALPSTQLRAGGGVSRKTAEEARAAAWRQAQALLDYAWQQVMEGNVQAPLVVPLRRACLDFVLLPALRLAPVKFQEDFYASRMAALFAVMDSFAGPGSDSANVPGARGIEEVGLMVLTATYRLLQHAYQALPPQRMKEQILKSFGGNAAVMKHAVAQMRGLAARSRALEPTAREARSAAFSCAVVLVAATQTKESFYAAPLRTPVDKDLPVGVHLTPGSGPWPLLLDISEDLKFSAESDVKRSGWERSAGAVRDIVERLRAQRKAGGPSQSGTFGTLGMAFIGSLGASMSLEAKLSASQYSLGDFLGPSDASEASTEPGTDIASASDPNPEEDDEIEDWDEPAGTGDDTLQFVDDSLDRHPSMLPLVLLVEKGATLAPIGAPMPSWMELLLKATASPSVPRSVRLFLAKLVIHVDRRHAARQDAAQAEGMDEGGESSIFGRFATQWFPALVDAVCGHTDPAETGVHYLLLDACIVFLGWSALFPRPPDVAASESLLDYLVRASYHTESAVRRNNFTLVKAFCGRWRSSVAIDPAALLSHLPAPGSLGSASGSYRAAAARRAIDRVCLGLKLLAAGLRYGQGKALLSHPDATTLVQRITQALNARGGQRLAAQAGETAGILLAMLTHLGADFCAGHGFSVQKLVEELRTAFISMTIEKSLDRMLAGVERLTAVYKPMVVTMYPQLVAALPRTGGRVQAVALEVLSRQGRNLPHLRPDIQQLLPGLLGSNDSAIQASTLSLLAELLQSENDDVAARQLIEQVLSHVAGSSSVDCRRNLFALLKDAWQTRGALRPLLRPPLLALLGDEDADLQAAVLCFWDSALSQEMPQRLRALLADSLDSPGAFGPRLEARWAQSAVSLLLELPASLPAYNKAVFDRELAECRFEAYPIDTWGQATLGPGTPLFSSQWQASQSQAGAASQGLQMSQAAVGAVRATQQATSSISMSLSLRIPEESGVGAAASRSPGGATASAANNARLHRRINKFEVSAAGIYARRRAARAASSAARERKVTLTRQYRKGELPDIQQVSVASFLGPLGIMAGRNATVAQLAFTALYRSCQQTFPGSLQQLRDALGQSFERRPRNPSYVACLQSAALADRGRLALPVDQVVEAAKASGRLQAGALQLEEQILFGSAQAQDAANPASKRQRRAEGPKAMTHPIAPALMNDEAAWNALADVYSQLGEEHLARVTTATHVAKCPGTKLAVAALAARRIAYAQTVCEALMRVVIEEDTSDLSVEGPDGSVPLTAEALLAGGDPPKEEELLWFQERTRCMEELGDWGQLLSTIESETDGNDAILFNVTPACNGPAYIRSFARACLFQSGQQERFGRLLEASAADPVRMRLLQERAPVEVALHAAADGKWDRCQGAVTAAMGLFREEWDSLHPLSQMRRLAALADLQPLAEMQEAMVVAKQEGGPSIAQVRQVAASWADRWPSPQYPRADGCLTLVNLRQILLEGLVRGAEKASKRRLWQEMGELQAGLFLGGASVLHQQGFLDAASDLLDKHQAAIAGSKDGDARVLAAAEARLALRLTQIRDCQGVGSRLRLELASELANLTRLKASAQAKDRLRLLIAEGQAHMSLATQGPTFGREMAAAFRCYQDAFHVSTMGPAPMNTDADAVPGHQEAGSEQAARASLELALLCKRLLDSGQPGGLPPEMAPFVVPQGGAAAMLVRCVLQALRYGGAGSEAQLYVPHALTLLRGDAAAQKAWGEFWAAVPLPALLPWASQMLSFLDAEEGAVLLPALKELARGHSQQLYFPFQLSQQSYGTVGRDRAKELEPMLRSPLLAEFAAALNDITFPGQRYSAWNLQMQALILAGRQDEAANLYAKDVYPDMIANHLSQRGARRASTTVNSEFAAKHEKDFKAAFGADGDKLRSMTPLQLSETSKKLVQIAQSFGSGITGKRDLARLSAWFAAFSESAGRRGDDKERLMMPLMPKVSNRASYLVGTGVCIEGFGKTVDVFASKQRPKKVTIIGTDFKVYEWIVKGGEEMRIDQRMEQLFDAMNGLLARHPGASGYNLAVRTYDVVPVSSSLGMMAFVGGTAPLLSVLCDVLDEQDLERAHTKYNQGLAASAGEKWDPSNLLGPPGYLKLFARGSRADVVTCFETAESQVRWDALREAFLRYASGPEEFLVLRRSFTASLAAVSVCGYLAGVGDRHTENFLLHPRSGQLIPIDFGYSFGTGVQVLPIPELTPFRLTRQMTGLLQPHDAAAVLQAPCAAALTALRAGHDILEGILGVFLREPLLDWQREANSLKAQGGKAQAAQLSSDEHISLKVGIAKLKLAGSHPVDIMLSELQEKHGKRPYWKGLQAIVRGDAAHDVRARTGGSDKALTPEDQAACLLDQARSPDILGRTWAGWKPWL